MCKFSAKACRVSLHYFIFYCMQYLLGNLLLMDVLASVNGKRKGSLKIGNTEKTQPSRIKIFNIVHIHTFVCDTEYFKYEEF